MQSPIWQHSLTWIYCKQKRT